VKPDVTVVIPTTNRSTLARALVSVQNQSFRRFQVVVVDDSIDQSVNMNKHITLKTGGLAGVSHSRNLGMSIVESEFIALLDDDDEWHHNYLESQLSNFRRLDIDFGITGALLGGRKRPRIPLQIGMDPFELLYGRPHLLWSDGYLPTSSYMFRASMPSKLIFDESLVERENLKFVKDCFDMGLRLFQDKDSLVSIHYSSRSSISRVSLDHEIKWAQYLMSLNETWKDNFLVESARNLFRNRNIKDAAIITEMIGANHKSIHKTILKILTN
jgi:glycosyltransferase involved in cell wall biosynthesis